MALTIFLLNAPALKRNKNEKSAEYSQQRAFCNLRSFMAVLYAENLTLFKSAKSRATEEKK